MPTDTPSRVSQEEVLSALMDGQCDELELHRLLGQCAGSESLRQQWSRYHLVSTVLQKQAIVLHDSLRFAESVQAGIALDAETASQLAAAPSHSGGRRLAARLAVAASVAFMVIVGTQWKHASEQEGQPVVAAAAPQLPRAEMPVANTVAPVADVSALGVDGLFSQSPETRKGRFTVRSGFENASLKEENVRAPLIHAADGRYRH